MSQRDGGKVKSSQRFQGKVNSSNIVASASSSLLTNSTSSALSPSPASSIQSGGTRIVKGHMVKIEGEIYIIKNAAGKKVRLHVDLNTAMDAFTTGDKIHVEISPKGTIVSIRKASGFVP